MEENIDRRGAFLMKFGIFLLFIIFGFLAYQYMSIRCRSVVFVEVGEVDSRFEVDRDEVISVAREAIARWNDQSGEDAIAYKEGAKIKIDLIYDERQADLDKLTKLQNDLATKEEEVSNTTQTYEKLVDQYQKKMEDYGNKVAYWNSRGGAPADIFQNLKKEEQDLDQERDTLVSMAKNLNLGVDSYNSDLDELKEEIKSRENQIITQGLFDPQTNIISIYTFGNKEELRLVLMHEMGHALGLDHSGDEKALMYYLLNNDSLNDPKLGFDDLRMLKERCSAKNINLYTDWIKDLEVVGF